MDKILLVEDDGEIAAMLKEFLELERFRVEIAPDGECACEMFSGGDYRLVLLDLMIPKISGMEVMKRIRKESTVPIIIVSAKDGDADKILGLGLGADDYITKPFSVTEVLARIRANIRRDTEYRRRMGAESADVGMRAEAEEGLKTGRWSGEGKRSGTNLCSGIGKHSKTEEWRFDAERRLAVEEPQEGEGVLSAGGIVMDVETYSVTKNGNPIQLTAKEFEILRLFLQNPRKVYTKEQIYSLVWNDAYLGDENAVNVHISRLRNKIEKDPRKPEYILTVWGIGYKLGAVK